MNNGWSLNFPSLLEGSKLGEGLAAGCVEPPKEAGGSEEVSGQATDDSRGRFHFVGAVHLLQPDLRLVLAQRLFLAEPKGLGSLRPGGNVLGNVHLWPLTYNL